MTPLTPARIAAIRAKNATRGPLEWRDGFTIDELLDCIEEQAREIDALRGGLMPLAQCQPGYWDGDDYYCTYCENSTQPTHGVERDLTNELIESYHDADCRWVAARRALRGEAVRDA